MVKSTESSSASDVSFETEGSSSYSSSSSSSSSNVDKTPISSPSWMNYIKEQFNDIVDEQRMERLQACRQIEDVYKDCRRYNKLMKQQQNLPQEERKSIERTVQLEDIPPGIRIVRYYDWRDIHDYDVTSNCIREKHAIWSCRASALQCGGELVQLRNCFNDVQKPPPGVKDPIYNKNYGAVLNVSTTAYEPKDRNSHKDIPCREFQEKMGSCIAKNASELAERETQRSIKQKAITK